MKRRLDVFGLFALVCLCMSGVSGRVQAQGGGGGGNGGGGGTTHSVDTTNTAVVKLSNFNRTFNGKSAKGQITLGYAADGTAQSMTYSLSQINVPDGTQLPVSIIMGRYQLIVSYYSYYGITYTTVTTYVTVNKGSVTLSLNKANGDAVPDFPAANVGTTEIQVYSADSATLFLDGSVGTLKP